MLALGSARDKNAAKNSVGLTDDIEPAVSSEEYPDLMLEWHKSAQLRNIGLCVVRSKLGDQSRGIIVRIGIALDRFKGWSRSGRYQLDISSKILMET
jgi:hypothetical protein